MVEPSLSYAMLSYVPVLRQPLVRLWLSVASGLTHCSPKIRLALHSVNT